MGNKGYVQGEYVPRENVHVHPVNDRFPHIMSVECHCHPCEHWLPNGNIVTVHNSWDHREFTEYKKVMN